MAACPSCGAPLRPDGGPCGACGATPGRDADPLLGQLLDGRFAIRDRIGAGGMGTVYRGRQLSVDRDVAVKVLRPELCHSPEQVGRFMTEARTASQLGHPNTVTVHDFGRTADGRVYLAMELLQGQPLSEILEQEGPLPWPRALGIIIQVCGSLAEAHSKGILHRDIKPDNLMIGEISGIPDFVKVLDFGIARSGETDSVLTRAGHVLGTPRYMAPEQARGEPIDHRADLYSVGVMLFELLTGHPPFDAETPLAVMMLQCTAEPPTLQETLPGLKVPSALTRLVSSLLAKEPAQRPTSAASLRARCEDILADHHVRPRRRAQPTPAPPEAAGTPRDAPDGPSLAALVCRLVRGDGETVFCGRDLPPHKLAQATEKWLYLERGEHVLLLVDASASRRTGEGLALTDRRLLWKAGHDEPWSLRLNTLRPGQLSLDGARLRVGAHQLEFSRQPQLTAQLLRLLTEVARTNPET